MNQLIRVSMFECRYCGKTFEDRKHKDRKYCCKPCFDKDLSELRRKNPYRQIAILNLPKAKRTVTPEWKKRKQRIKSQMFSFRKMILQRDKKCRDCGSTEKLGIHHIAELCKFPELAFMPMNAIALCASCHKKTDNYASHRSELDILRQDCGTFSAVLRVIPHHWREYDTIGNWSFGENDVLAVFVSNTGDTLSNCAVILHEFVEAIFCKQRGISEQSVTQFDLNFKGDDEPGDSPDAPYYHEHQDATKIERMFLELAGVSWAEHSKRCDALDE